jgi:death-on-curing protein
MNQPRQEPTWLSKPAILAIHGMLLAEHGGATGLRDEGLLESAMAGPRNQFLYGESDLFQIGAAYAFALTRNHPFVDGNKRTAFAAAGIFLELNGFELRASEPDAVHAVLALSKGDIDSEGFGNWLRLFSVELDEMANGPESP